MGRSPNPPQEVLCCCIMLNVVARHRSSSALVQYVSGNLIDPLSFVFRSLGEYFHIVACNKAYVVRSSMVQGNV
jgi:hypothetical protein